MTQNKVINLDCPACGGPLEVEHNQSNDKGQGIVKCQKCHKEFGSWDAFKKEFIDPMTGESQDERRKDVHHRHHRHV